MLVDVRLNWHKHALMGLLWLGILPHHQMMTSSGQAWCKQANDIWIKCCNFAIINSVALCLSSDLLPKSRSFSKAIFFGKNAMPLFLVVMCGMSTFLLMESLSRDGYTQKSHQLSSIQVWLHFHSSLCVDYSCICSGHSILPSDQKAQCKHIFALLAACNSVKNHSADVTPLPQYHRPGMAGYKSAPQSICKKVDVDLHWTMILVWFSSPGPKKQKFAKNHNKFFSRNSLHRKWGRWWKHQRAQHSAFMSIWNSQNWEMSVREKDHLQRGRRIGEQTGSTRFCNLFFFFNWIKCHFNWIFKLIVIAFLCIYFALLNLRL